MQQKPSTRALFVSCSFSRLSLLSQVDLQCHFVISCDQCSIMHCFSNLPIYFSFLLICQILVLSIFAFLAVTNFPQHFCSDIQRNIAENVTRCISNAYFQEQIHMCRNVHPNIIIRVFESKPTALVSGMNSENATKYNINFFKRRRDAQ